MAGTTTRAPASVGAEVSSPGLPGSPAKRTVAVSKAVSPGVADSAKVTVCDSAGTVSCSAYRARIAVLSAAVPPRDVPTKTSGACRTTWLPARSRQSRVNSNFSVGETIGQNSVGSAGSSSLGVTRVRKRTCAKGMVREA